MSNGVDFRNMCITMRDDINRLTAECDALQQRLNAVEEENDRLRSALTTLRNHTGVSGNQIDMIDSALGNRS